MENVPPGVGVGALRSLARASYHAGTCAPLSGHPAPSVRQAATPSQPPGCQPDASPRIESPWQRPTSAALACGVGASVAQRRRALAGRVRRAAEAADSQAAGPSSAEPKAGVGVGPLGVWRSKKDPRLPVILFSETDLLLLGHTKRMHLFEPRWTQMVDGALQEFGGLICLVYFSRDGDVQRFSTIAEIIACNNLEAAGRMVVVRGVARAELKGLSQDVVSRDDWGLALLDEWPEVRAEDLEAKPAEAFVNADAMTSVAVATSELSAQFAGLDLSVPPASSTAEASGSEGAESSLDKGAKSRGREADEDVEDDEDEDEDDYEDSDEEEGDGGVRLWTHERVPVGEEFEKSAGSQNWASRCEEVERTLAGVPICTSSGATVTAEALSAVAALYASLGVASLETRLDVFGSERGLSARLRAITSQLKERQGMARAKRALAALFSEADSDNKSGEEGASKGDGAAAASESDAGGKNPA